MECPLHLNLVCLRVKELTIEHAILVDKVTLFIASHFTIATEFVVFFCWINFQTFMHSKESPFTDTGSTWLVNRILRTFQMFTRNRCIVLSLTKLLSIISHKTEWILNFAITRTSITILGIAIVTVLVIIEGQSITIWTKEIDDAITTHSGGIVQ